MLFFEKITILKSACSFGREFNEETETCLLYTSVDDKRYSAEIAKMKDWLLKKLIETTDNVPMKTMLPGRTYGEE